MSPKPSSDLDTATDAQLAAIVGRYLTVESQLHLKADSLTAEDATLVDRMDCGLRLSFVGSLLMDAERAYDALDAALQPYDLFALFRENPRDTSSMIQSPHVVHIISRRLPEALTPKIWPALLLFVLTLLSMMWTGALIAKNIIALDEPALAADIEQNLLLNLWRGLPYAVSLLLILVPHELGHYLTMRRYGVAPSPPYFIPGMGVSPFGTFGAAIALRTPLKNRKVLLDVGAAGPFAGLLAAIPVLLLGLLTSPVTPITDVLVEGKSVVYALAQVAVFGEWLPDTVAGVDVMVNQLAWAGWTGLFVTALNLLPIGQFDGGHVLFAWLGGRARRWYPAFLLLLLVLSLFASVAWLLLIVLLLLFGRSYALPLDAITPLNPARKRIAQAVLLLFALTFVPAPLYRPEGPNGLLGLPGPEMLLMLPVLLLVTLALRRC